ncbi:type I-E CRISPR-associated protein Cse1/CasA [Desulforhabdus sp. TSK]|uniref:type I-E CRISPR-associated protein Cse1/CasA n=1 Tax=Desulforhabdus sp. TSK TaxID=2925014 RepID=UPI001FC829B7|nr:type I-E CRISPR-associated protein Cse1/CasA [Desulforhabdus sp. TSK]GKT09234.1 hypothetical protein DSTSK_25390 [Desulforhabdus sp. TSK]
MNVAFDPWIPVVDASGRRQRASLLAILTEGERFTDLSVRPHERVSLMRLFLGVAHAALEGPKDYDEWCEVPHRLPDAAARYLLEWKDSFELFHPEKPWLQVAGLRGTEKGGDKPGKTSPVSLLAFELATGNNSTLYDHGGQRIFRHIEPGQTALNLLTFQNFSSGGGSPVAQWKNVKTSQVGNPDAPCLSQSMAHCLLRGKTLQETLHLNLPTYETVKLYYRIFSTNKKDGVTLTPVPLGRPVWEFFPESPDNHSNRVENATKTYIGRLTPLARWIRLIPGSDQMYCCNGFKYETFRDGFASEPTAAVQVVTRKDKKGAETMERKVVKAESTKALWRELSSLVVKRSTEGLGGPLAMANAPLDSPFDFHVCAITRDQASMDIAVESVFHITPAFQIRTAVYHAEVVGTSGAPGAEGYARRLRMAIEVYRQTIDNDWNSRVKRAQARDQGTLRDRVAQTALLSYWTTVEKNLPLLMEHIEAIGSDAAIPTREAWRKMLSSAAREAYRIACGQGTPRQMRAFAEGWQKLTGSRHSHEPVTHEMKEDAV